MKTKLIVTMVVGMCGLLLTNGCGTTKQAAKAGSSPAAAKAASTETEDEKSFGNQRRWTMANGDIISIHGGRTPMDEVQGGWLPIRIEVGSGKLLVEFKSLENIGYDGIVQSDGKTALLVLIRYEVKFHTFTPGGGIGYNYAFLGVVSLRKSGTMQEWIFRRCLPSDGVWQVNRKRFVSALGAVDDAGRRALIKVGEYDSKNSEQLMRYAWQIWDLKEETMLSEGVHPFRSPQGFWR